MEDLLIESLKDFGYPVIRQGSLAPLVPYPRHFFTFWNNSSDGDGFYNNQETKTIWDFDLNFYSVDPGLTYSVLLDAKRVLKKAGFIVTGKGHDVASDEITHTGRGISVSYIENL